MSLQYIRHTWDAGGNLSQRQNVVAGETENLGYDFLDRLTSVSEAYSQSYSYNQIGNITYMNGSSGCSGCLNLSFFLRLRYDLLSLLLVSGGCLGYPELSFFRTSAIICSAFCSAIVVVSAMVAVSVA
jgi:hypothetical protein